MAALDVRTPDGTLWVIRRRWTNWGPRRARYRRRMQRVQFRLHKEAQRPLRTDPEIGATPADPALMAIVELPVEAVVAFVSMLGKVILRRPWRIEGVSSDGQMLTVHRVGWDDSLRLCRDMATQLGRGVDAEDLTLPPVRGPWEPSPSG